MFWNIASKMPVQANPIVCWKFLQVIHKLMRDGHPNVVPDSYKYCSQLRDLGKLWGHLKEGYGKLIALYCTLLIQKLNFHRKFPRIPGNLMMTDEQYYKICGNNVDNYFEFSIDMLDYMEEILNLQQSVFGSLDMSRANSMTNAGQCRLAPLILCILDSCQLYDYLVRSLFSLHSSLPPDTLSGHRERFLQCYRRLKEFYHKCGNLQYFKHLVQVPSLPDEPPNFLVASDFSKHVKPVAVVPDPEPEMDADNDSVDNLINTSLPDESQFEEAFGDSSAMGSFNFNGRPDERDLLIERLQQEIQELKFELERVKMEDQRQIDALNGEINKLKKILSELRLSADKSLKENEMLKRDLEIARAESEAASKLPEAEKNAKANQEKFQKMKDIYGKLREEHVQLLRNHAEVSKQLATEKKIVEEKNQVIKEVESERRRAEENQRVMQENLQKSADDISVQLAQVSSSKSQLEEQKQASQMEDFFTGWQRSKDLENQIQTLRDIQADLEKQLDQIRTEAGDLKSSLENTQREAGEAEAERAAEISCLQAQLEKTQRDKQNLEESLRKELAEVREQLDRTLVEKQSIENDLASQLDSLTEQLAKLSVDKEESEKHLSNQIDDLHKSLIGSVVAEGRAIITDAMDQSENPAHSDVKCTAEFLIQRTAPILEKLEKLRKVHNIYSADRKDLQEFVTAISDLSHHMADSLLHGFATAHAAQIEPGEELTNACKDAGGFALSLLNSLENNMAAVPDEINSTKQKVQHVLQLAEALVPKMEDVKVKEIGDLVENEMQSTTAAIEAAAQKMQQMLQKTREDTTGINLEVNERILDSCTELMKAIKVLVEKSRDLQKEIIMQGRGTSSSKDFYKKNHRWTEGLLSAAKAVGWGATALLDTADRVVQGKGKFEELMACAHEIAASTTQLVVASKVKADRGSKNLAALSSASKSVNTCTGSVVASAKTGAQIVEDAGLMDFSNMSLHQTKKMEMQTQIRVMELETELERERRRLGELRKQHYQMGGEAEGWEVAQDGEGVEQDPHGMSSPATYTKEDSTLFQANRHAFD
ncbi:huntingtin-interacting protein 1-like isoform X2 [Pomacea canaliculata]|uniref:huntingtin-interacting protein 1-like isoform X2 n=1 Tax=Pomacea canaliculata TaxID=400727 RepID=UPI000D7322A6|nr:huntingtin-interacting protein 1-like isoform X2 [Pomacea canaliculata]